MLPVDEPARCGRIMVGSGTDTYDPVCELAAGHRGPCKSSAAVDQHRLPTPPVVPVDDEPRNPYPHIEGGDEPTGYTDPRWKAWQDGFSAGSGHLEVIAAKAFAADRAAERAANVKLLRTRETDDDSPVNDWLRSFADRVLDETDASSWDECAALRNVAADLLARSSVPSDPKETNDA